jgi:hypothetical protein
VLCECEDVVTLLRGTSVEGATFHASTVRAETRGLDIIRIVNDLLFEIEVFYTESFDVRYQW